MPFCGRKCQVRIQGRHYPMCRRIFAGNIAKLTLKNEKFGPVVIYEDPSGHDQIALMAVPEGQVVKKEVHEDLTQFVRVEQGRARVVTGSDPPVLLEVGGSVVVPAGTEHEITSLGPETLKLYTIYSKDVSKKWEHKFSD